MTLLKRISTASRTRALTALALVPLFLIGCGYALVGRTSTLPEDVRNIYVEALKNTTRRSQLEQVLARAIADEFVTRRRFEVVRNRSEADGILSGTVNSYYVRPVTFASGGRATEYEIVIGAQMLFTRANGDEVLWQQDRYTFRELYEANVSEADFFSRQDEAIEEVAVKFAQTLVIDLLEGF
ncbi:MAG: LptE family protein [bacterium]|nr:LptE family protein [bacterium]